MRESHRTQCLRFCRARSRSAIAPRRLNGNMTTPEKPGGGLPDTATRHGKQFVPYLQSLTQELAAIQTRVRLLVQHWPSDGHFKESILRQVLRRHLPANVSVGTGFVVNFFGPSGEIDIVITDDTMPTLFRDGELVIVTPESVRAIIEVKTTLSGPAAIEAAAAQLAKRKAVVERHVQCDNVWAGLFVYASDGDRHSDLLAALYNAWLQERATVDFVALGQHVSRNSFAHCLINVGSVHRTPGTASTCRTLRRQFYCRTYRIVGTATARSWTLRVVSTSPGFRRRRFITKRRDSKVESFRETTHTT